MSNKHANNEGCYLASCIWYLVIYNANELPNYVPPVIDKEEVAELARNRHKGDPGRMRPAKGARNKLNAETALVVASISTEANQGLLNKPAMSRARPCA